MEFSNNCAQGEGSKCICWKAVRRKRAQREGREEAFESEKGAEGRTQRRIPFGDSESVMILI